MAKRTKKGVAKALKRAGQRDPSHDDYMKGGKLVDPSHDNRPAKKKGGKKKGKMPAGLKAYLAKKHGKKKKA
jgi:hypothetical protein